MKAGETILELMVGFVTTELEGIGPSLHGSHCRQTNT
jgi:hypothetical protein